MEAARNAARENVPAEVCEDCDEYYFYGALWDGPARIYAQAEEAAGRR